LALPAGGLASLAVVEHQESSERASPVLPQIPEVLAAGGRIARVAVRAMSSMSTREGALRTHLAGVANRIRDRIGLRAQPDDELPLRAELFSADQMEQYGTVLAASHQLSEGRGPDHLLARLADNESTLRSICSVLTVAVTANHQLTPAGEWLLDNLYLIQEQIRTAKRHLPKGYSRELPRLERGSSAGLPRVYDIALQTISHGDGRVDTESLSRFVAAYQTVSPLQLGELWAIPIMLRLALIENLRRVGARVAAGRVDRNLADRWADEMTEVTERDPKSLILVVADMARSDPPMTTPFVSELARRLRGQGPALALPLTWIEQRLAESNRNIEQLVQSGNQQQAADQVTISNSIGSLRMLGALDWREFAESNSIVEQTLRQDPNGVYGRMDFATRDRYRHVVEHLAKTGAMHESAVAGAAVELARGSAANAGADDPAAHVGFYLIDKGLPKIEAIARARTTPMENVSRAGREHPLFYYLSTILLITAGVAGALTLKAHADGAREWLLAAVAVLTTIGSSQLAIELVNWVSQMVVTPHPLPRMDFSEGIPPASSTLVVVPTLLTGNADVADLAEALEVRFLANRDRNLHFALLTDFKDADREVMPEDAALLQLARTSIDALNEKYRGPAPVASNGDTVARDDRGAEPSPFFLFHRPRTWNPQEQIWMGFERKRGKLGALNALLRGKENAFSLVVGDVSSLADVKYVISLDTDTQLPRDAARQFVGAMAHPLNRPRFAARRGSSDASRVTSGYGILQPRVAVSLPGTNRSRYARLFGGEPGIDPYTRIVSDVYQDVFGEGSFIGKGIYDVDAFERALESRLPENRILSHDLLEGCYARAGLLTDVQLYEEFPARYSADVGRRHRWIRGDWQIAAWAMARVPGADGRPHQNPLSGLSRWKIFDNLRRSVVPAALVLLFILGWMALPRSGFWTLTVLGFLAIPSIVTTLVDLVRKPPEVLMMQQVGVAMRSAGRRFGQALFGLACLPYDAYFSVDAILRALFRMTVKHRGLLEWSPSREVQRESDLAMTSGTRAGLNASFRKMWIAPAIAVGVAVGTAIVAPSSQFIALPILVLWTFSPALGWWISRPLTRRSARLTDGQTQFLRLVARRTWAFFDTFVGPADHWLPPDNFQEHPVPIVAHRTSPTNMGLSLLANVAAFDFGYITPGQLVERTDNALSSMRALERHRGHFYNWYDTQSLAPLLPRYISTVDSGNLAGHLLTLRAALVETSNEPIVGPAIFLGLGDTLRIAVEAARSSDATAGRTGAALNAFANALAAASAARPMTLFSAREHLEKLLAIAQSADSSIDAGASGSIAAATWLRALIAQCEAAVAELRLLAPWSTLSPTTPGMRDLTRVADMPSLRQISNLGARLSSMDDLFSDVQAGSAESGRVSLRALVAEASQNARERLALLDRLQGQISELAQMEYDFLYDAARRQLAIGYNVADRRLDASFYDLLASEARLANFVAIAQGQLPQESWFALGRTLTTSGGAPILLSWSGSMFEYLMPMLVMPTYENTLLDQTCIAAVDRQIAYGGQRGVAWGISECGYNNVDVNLSYQYRAFGVPGLGLKRGLGDDLVIAPYASTLALMVAPEAACSNLEQLATEGVAGDYGFYEAIDYTPSRLRRGETRAVIRSFMAHHQGMSLLSLAYLLLGRPMQRRFESDPLFQATMLLLQERIPRATAMQSPAAELPQIRAAEDAPEMPMRILATADTPIPEVQLLSNGRYHVMVSNSGGGSSRWKDLSVTRWREDSTCDNWGHFCYLRDVTSGEFWSTSHQPTLKSSKRYEVIFSEGRVEFRRRDFDFDTHTEITVSPEDDIELRRVRITNRARTRRTIEVTTYAEVVLATAASDAQAPAFGNLFVQTEILDKRHAILCTRRPRAQSDPTPWMFHLMAVHGATAEPCSYETDRMRFLGRGRSAFAPEAMLDPSPLSGTAGSVLDPIVAIRQRVSIEPGESAIIDIVTGVGDSRDAVMGLVDKYQDPHLADRVFDLAWTHSLVVLRQLNATEADAQLFGRLAGSVLYANASLRAEAGILRNNQRGQSGLWGYSISGDLPIVLLQISDATNVDMVQQMVQAHAYWRLKGLAVDLIIWNEDHSGYRQLLQDQIMGLVASGVDAQLLDRPGGIFVRRAEQIAAEDRILMQSVARVIISDSKGSFSDQVNRRALPEPPLARTGSAPIRRSDSSRAVVDSERSLLFDNGVGGFAADGREYVITTGREQATPVPWSNVIANAQFGTVITESGQAYSWGENAHEFRLTPWHGDPVSDCGGEAFYLRDEESGSYWSPTPLPKSGATPYVTRHGFGYSVFEHSEEGIRSELWIYVALDASVKFAVLKLRNESGRPRKLSATGYVEWVLGDLRAKTGMHVVTEIDHASGALLARNPYNSAFSDRIAFFDTDAVISTVTGDRTEFIGRNGGLNSPASMATAELSGRVGPALDPCGAIRVAFELADGQASERVFRLGVGQNRDDARKLVQRFRGSAAARDALDKVRQYWQRTVGAVQVKTPDPSLDVLTNGWLLYQVLACRVWGRSGFYQSGGAYGFRDQLQDTMALVHAEPALLREQLIRCASRQYLEGDVQHWWHPPEGRGVRTRCSDDYLWLPLATCRYVAATGDAEVLDASAPFLEGRSVGMEEDSYYDLPVRSEQAASLYEHCRRAITYGLRFGEHGLPLMGTGDWNDGMNLVGFRGKGESIWLAFFLFEVLVQFAAIAARRGDTVFVERCETAAADLRSSIDQHGWDGQWYRRAYFDDGTPLGSAVNPECRIDSIAQSWSVLSGAGSGDRPRLAMAALDEHLVKRDARLVQLLDPPFDHSPLNPGYIKGYVPGVRENGGQYTHAAIWATMAFAMLGDRKRAWELLAMINPVRHATTAEAVAIYKTEPYVVAADVYALSPHTGRGGWSWYTGSAGWLYRLILETLLGVTLEADKLRLAPRIPADWTTYAVDYRYGDTTYHITVVQGRTSKGESTLSVDGEAQSELAIALVDDGAPHVVEMRLHCAPE
jgi:cyclic beta-1,2-glucan synthetase